MRLLRLEGDGLGGRAIDLHPEISILTDLDDDLRDRLLRACQSLPVAGDPGCEGLIEAHGVLIELSAETLSMLGLAKPLDVLTTRAAPPDEPVEDGPSPFEALETAVAELRSVRGELDRAQLDLLNQLESARAGLDPFARTAFEQAQATQDREAGLSEIDDQLEAIEDAGPLRARLAELEQIDVELNSVDQDAIIEALEAAVAEEQVDAAGAEAGRLAVELRQIDTELADLDAVLTAQGLHPLELARQRDALSIDVARLESEHAPREIPQDQRDAIEAAEDAVVEAEAKISGSLLGGRGAEAKFEEARADLERLLEEVGLPTYSAYVMSVTVGSVDADLDNRLHEARQKLAACQAEYEAATTMLEEDPVRTMLTLRQEEIVARAGELIERNPGPDVVGELLAFKERRDHERPIDGLRHQLERAGLVEPGHPHDDQDVCEIASDWLESRMDLLDSADERAEEAESVRLQLAEIDEARADIDRRREDVVDSEPAPEFIDAVQRLEAHEAAMTRVAELTDLLEDVDKRRHEIEEQLDAQQVLAELARPGVDEAPVEPSEEERIEEIRALFKVRLAQHRDRSFAGSVPMVIRGVFNDSSRDQVGDLLSELEELASGVQLIILDDDLPVATWATSVGFERAAVVSPE